MAVSTLIILAVFFAVFLGLAVLDIVMSKKKNQRKTQPARGQDRTPQRNCWRIMRMSLPTLSMSWYMKGTPW